MSVISASKYCEAAEMLLGHAATMAIPYTPGGYSLMGMDCQGLCEYLLMQCGIPYRECNLAGSNAHYRACVWTGTPEECKQQFGHIPAGAWLFILEQDGGEPDKYKDDGIGNASHMGVYLGNGVAIHASASRGKVAESDFPERTIPNGGWNQVGLPKWIEYGADEKNLDEAATAYVTTGDGNPVKLRSDPSTKNPYVIKVPVGSMVEIVSNSVVDGVEWARVNVDGKNGYMMSQFLSSIPSSEPNSPITPADEVAVRIDRDAAQKLLDTLSIGLKGGD